MIDPMFGMAILFGLLALALSLVHRKERDRLNVALACKEKKIEKIEGDMLALMDERNRYKGSYVVRPATPEEAQALRDQLRAQALIRDVGCY